MWKGAQTGPRRGEKNDLCNKKGMQNSLSTEPTNIGTDNGTTNMSYGLLNCDNAKRPDVHMQNALFALIPRCKYGQMFISAQMYMWQNDQIFIGTSQCIPNDCDNPGCVITTMQFKQQGASSKDQPQYANQALCSQGHLLYPKGTHCKGCLAERDT
eukprot:scaffold86721_cov19-Prasinocladus_malaysianus.AAC.1